MQTISVLLHGSDKNTVSLRVCYFFVEGNIQTYPTDKM